MKKQSAVTEAPSPVSPETVWKVTGVIVGVFASISAAIGQGDGGDSIESVVGYTLPLTVGFAVIFLGFKNKVIAENPGPVTWAAAAAVLWITGLAAGAIGYRNMTFERVTVPGGSPLNSVAGFAGSVFAVYLNAYGWPLIICAAAIGYAIAHHVHSWWVKNHSSQPPSAG